MVTRSFFLHLGVQQLSQNIGRETSFVLPSNGESIVLKVACWYARPRPIINNLTLIGMMLGKSSVSSLVRVGSFSVIHILVIGFDS